MTVVEPSLPLATPDHSGRHGQLRIAVVGPSRFGIAEPFAGGLEAHTATLALALTAAGHIVTVFAGPATDPRPASVAVVPVVANVLDLSPDQRRDIDNSPAWLASERAGYERAIERIACGGFDVVHNLSLHAAPIAGAARAGCPVVHTLHTPPLPTLVEAHRRHSGLPVAAVSASLGRSWGDIATDVITNGVDTRRWRPLRRRRPTRAGACVWVGRIVPEKGPHHAIDAARRARRSLVLAGPVLDTRYYRAEVLPRLGPDAVHVGHLDSARLRRLCAEAAVGIVTPCWEEPFGLVVAEFLACGTPVAAFARGAMAEIVTPLVGALAPPDDTDALAAAITRAAALDRRACRAHAVACLSAASMAQRYLDLYRSTRGAAWS